MRTSRTILVYCLTIFILTGCEQYDKRNLMGGSWHYDAHSPAPSEPIEYLQFTEDSVKMARRYDYALMGSYSISGRNLLIHLDVGQVFQFKIKHLSDDTLAFYENATFWKWSDGAAYTSYDPYYRLAGISTGFIESPEIARQHRELLRRIGTGAASFHYYKDAEHIPQIRVRKRNVHPDELRWFFGNVETVVILVGEGITLRDLAALYGHLHLAGVCNARLLLNVAGMDSFEYFDDKIELWYDDAIDLNEMLRRPPGIPPAPPSPPPPLNRRQYLQSGTTFIEINHSDQIGRLKDLDQWKKYLVGIDLDLSLADYIRIKMLTQAQQQYRNIMVRTELRPK